MFNTVHTKFILITEIKNFLGYLKDPFDLPIDFLFICKITHTHTHTFTKKSVDKIHNTMGDF